MYIAGSILLYSIINVYSHVISLPENLIFKEAQVNTFVSSEVKFSEGPAVDSSGNLYFSDRNPSRVWKVTPDGNATVFMHSANDANGMVFDPDGRLIICVNDGLIRIEKDSSTTILLKADTLKYSNGEGPNDLALTSTEGIFFTSSEWDKYGRVFFRRPDGNVKTILTFPVKNYPNGVAYIEEKKLLYLCLTQSNKVLKYQVNDDMNVSEIGKLCDVGSPDGLAVDNEGNLWIAGSDGGQPGVIVFDTSGNKLGKIGISGQMSVQNCAFGGLGRKNLYIAGKTAVYRVKTIVGGRSTTGTTTDLNRKRFIISDRNLLQYHTSKQKNYIKLWTINGKYLGEHLNFDHSRNLPYNIEDVIFYVNGLYPTGVYYVEFIEKGFLQKKIVNIIK